MSQKHQHPRGTEGAEHGHKHEHGHHHPPKSRGLHRDWRVWVAVMLMLLAMGVYVMTLDESIWPFGGGGTGEQAPVPAAAP